MVTEVMGILNVTPDSFSDGGRLGNFAQNQSVPLFKIDIDKALFKVEEMINDGAAIIDVGGESTRPGFEIVPAQEEIERTIPVIKAIKERFDIKVSLDTNKSKVALEGIKAGIDIINDIGMLSMDEGMLKVLIDNKDVEYVLMHNKAGYTDLIEDMRQTVEMMLEKGISRDKIILDPGIGFNKSYEQNVCEIRNIDKLCNLGMRTLLGVSNKSVIGNTLNLPVDERLEGTIALSVLAVRERVDIIRVHDVKANVRAIRMAEKILFG